MDPKWNGKHDVRYNIKILKMINMVKKLVTSSKTLQSMSFFYFSVSLNNQKWNSVASVYKTITLLQCSIITVSDDTSKSYTSIVYLVQKSEKHSVE